MSDLSSSFNGKAYGGASAGPAKVVSVRFASALVCLLCFTAATACAAGAFAAENSGRGDSACVDSVCVETSNVETPNVKTSNIETSHASTSYVDTLIAQAARLKLHQDPYWLVLLHYKRGVAGLRSLVDDPRFFIAPNGKTDPADELSSDLKGFFEAETPDDERPACRFPARFAWLKERLSIDDAFLPAADCAAYKAARARVNPASAVFVFPTAFMNRPASLFGHTFIRIDNDRKSKLLAHAVNYSAFTQGAGGVMYSFRGVFGGFKGYYSIMPYYEKVKEYGDIDQRDIWEYNLNLSRREVERMFQHIWELKDIYTDYYFFDENCSYMVLFLLEAARPGLHLTDDFLWVIPLDTVRAVQRAGLVESIAAGGGASIAAGGGASNDAGGGASNDAGGRTSADGGGGAALPQGISPFSASNSVSPNDAGGGASNDAVGGASNDAGGQAAVVYRPSKAASMRRLAAALNDSDMRLAVALAQGDIKPSAIQSGGVADARTVLDLAAEIIQYKYFKEEFSKDAYQERYLSVLSERSKLPDSAAPREAALKITPNASPEKPRPENTAQAAPENSPEAKSQPAPEIQLETKSQPRPEIQPEAKLQPRPENTPETKSQPRPEITPETKSQPRPDTQPEIQAETRPVDPRLGHRSARVFIGGGFLNGGEFFDEFSIRPAYHGLLDPGEGYMEGSQLVFAGVRTRYYHRRQQFVLEGLDLIDIVSIAPRDELFRPLSWKVATGTVMRMMEDGARRNTAYVNGGGGLSWKSPSVGIFYVFADGDFTAGPKFRNGDRYAAGAGFSAGVLTDVARFWKVDLSARGMQYFAGDDNVVAGAALRQSFTVNPNNAVTVDLSGTRSYDIYRSEVRVGWNYFF